jgi:hypothetical protein
VWFAALVVALLMSGSPSVACPSLSLVCPAESAPPTQDGEDDTTDEVTRTPRLATVRLSSITTTDIPPGSVPLAFSRPPTAPLDTPVLARVGPPPPLLAASAHIPFHPNGIPTPALRGESSA